MPRYEPTDRTLRRDDNSVFWTFEDDQPHQNSDIERAFLEGFATPTAIDEGTNTVTLTAIIGTEVRQGVLLTDNDRAEIQAAIDATKAIFGWGDAKAIAYLKLMREFVRRVQ